jgi:hypothetical protein
VPSCSAHVSHALIPGDTQPGALVVCELLARRGHQRCHCNEEGFGTSSRQLGNDQGYRSSCAAVSGRFTAVQPPSPMALQKRWRRPR